MYIFLYKDNSDDRDCVAYVQIEDLEKNHLCCDNHFNKHGSCYSCSLMDNGKYGIPYEDIETTILTEEEYHTLCNPKNKDLTAIITKLKSEDNQKLFEKVIKEEIEYLIDEYALSEENIKEIFDNYYLDYRDRSIVGCVYDDAHDCGYEEAINLGYVDNKDPIATRYFDFEQFGQDLVDWNDSYLKLDNGRIVYLNY